MLPEQHLVVPQQDSSRFERMPLYRCQSWAFGCSISFVLVKSYTRPICHLNVQIRRLMNTGCNNITTTSPAELLALLVVTGLMVKASGITLR